MKKLILILLPLLLFFGVSFADTWDFTPYTPNSALTIGNTKLASHYFTILWNYPNTIDLYQIRQSDWNTCDTWYLYKYDTTISDYVVLYTGTFSIPVTWSLQTINANWLLPWNYVIAMYSVWWCVAQYYNEPVIYWSWFFMSFWWFRNFNDYTLKFILTTASWPYQLVFSWTNPLNPAPATPITINYNWTTVSFTGSNIYLNDLFHVYTMSGSDIVFQPYVYRALFRSH